MSGETITVQDVRDALRSYETWARECLRAIEGFDGGLALPSPPPPGSPRPTGGSPSTDPGRFFWHRIREVGSAAVPKPGPLKCDTCEEKIDAICG